MGGALVCLGGLGGMLIALPPTSESSNEFAADLGLTELENRVGGIARSLQAIEDSRQREPNGLVSQQTDQLNELLLRVEELEHAILHLADVQDDPLRSEPDLVPPRKTRDLLPPHHRQNYLATTFASEEGSSEWGHEIVAETEARFLTDPFFNELGGDLEADCRRTACKLIWRMPAPELLAPEQRDLMFLTAKYELAALTALGEQGVGQFEAQWHTSGAEPYVAVYVSKQ